MPQFLRTFPEVDPDVTNGAEFNKGSVSRLENVSSVSLQLTDPVFQFTDS
jgi:hypothetical protein